MNNYNNQSGHKSAKSILNSLVIFSLLSVTFLISPVMAGEMAAEFAKVEKAEKFTTEAYKISVKAKTTGDIRLNEETLKVLKEGVELLSEVAPIAYDAGVVKLCQRVLNAAKREVFLIAQVINTTENTIQTSTDEKVVDIAKKILIKAKLLKNEAEINIKISLACGAVPEPAEAYEPPEKPFPDPPKPEPPEPASGT